MNEARLIEAFIDALRENPAAEPPPGLDPELAEIVRDVVVSEQSPDPGARVLARIWQRAVIDFKGTESPISHPNSNGRQPHNRRPNDKEKKIMTTTVGGARLVPAVRYRVQWTWIAAVMVVVLFGGVLMFVALGNRSSDDPTTLFISPQDTNKAVFVRFIKECWEDGDLSLVDTLLTDDFVRHESGTPDMGKADLPALISNFRAAFPDGVNDITQISAEDDRVWVQGTFTATFSGVFMLGAELVVPPTDAPVTFDVMTVARFVDGKIAEQWVISDSLTFMAQIGAVSTPDVVLAEQQTEDRAMEILQYTQIDKNTEDFADYWADPVKVYSPINTASWIAPLDAWEGGLTQFSMSNERWTIEHVWVDNDLVAVQARIEGKFDEPAKTPNNYTMLQPTGEYVTWREMFVYRLEDGKVAEYWDYSTSWVPGQDFCAK